MKYSNESDILTASELTSPVVTIDIVQTVR